MAAPAFAPIVTGHFLAVYNIDSVHQPGPHDAFGNLTYSGGSQASANPYRYNTKWCHAVSGPCNYGYRWYNPSAGRWINRDPIDEYGGTNLYAFVGNNPMNALDARGMCGTVE